MILFGQGGRGIWQVPGTSGTPEVLIPMEDGERAHGPQMLPGGEWVLFTLQPRGLDSWDQAQIVVQSLETGDRTVLIEAGRDARYVPTGHLVYGLNGMVFAVPFDLGARQVTGRTVPLVDGVADGGLFTGAVQFSVATNSSLVYVSGGAGGGGVSTLVWVDRLGREELLGADRPPDQYAYPRLSPDGTRVAVAIAENVNALAGPADLWVLDLARGSRSRITFGGNNRYFPVWSPEGSQLAFADGSGNPNRLLLASADGSGQIETLLDRDERQFPTSWAPDGQALAIHVVHPETNRDLAVLPLEGDRTPVPVLATPFRERAGAFSPNGRWLAYVSDESGQDEVYVRPYPGPGQEHTISTTGGVEPVWSPAGEELFYRNGDQVMVVQVNTAEAFRAESPELLFVGRYHLDHTTLGVPNYDVSPDGQRLLMIKPGAATDESARAPQINVVLNWFEELKRRVPTDRCLVPIP